MRIDRNDNRPQCTKGLGKRRKEQLDSTNLEEWPEWHRRRAEHDRAIRGIYKLRTKPCGQKHVSRTPQAVDIRFPIGQ